MEKCVISLSCDALLNREGEQTKHLYEELRRYSEDEDGGPIHDLATCLLGLCCSNFEDVIRSAEPTKNGGSHSVEKVVAATKDFIKLSKENNTVWLTEMTVGTLAAVFLSLFVQVNFTGPPLPEDSMLMDFTFDVTPENDIDTGGEVLTEKVTHLDFLLLSRRILECVEDSENGYIHLWKARTCYFHQQLLSDRIYELKECVLSSFNKFLLDEQYSSHEELRSIVLCEKSLAYLYYYEGVEARSTLDKARVCAGCDVLLAGAMGKRTRFQEKSLPQLVVRVNSQRSSTSSAQPTEKESTNAIPLNDDTVLEAVMEDMSENGEERMPLSVSQMAVFAAEAAYVEDQEPDDEIRREKLSAYVDRGLEVSGVCWVLFRALLVLRSSHVDIHKTRKIERGVLQLDTLYHESEQDFVRGWGGVERADELSTRMNSVWAAGDRLSSRSSLAKKCGEAYVRVGAAATALGWFDRLDMWDDAIQCLLIMNENEKALSRVQKKLADEEECGKVRPLTLCLHGDITNDMSYYDKAWEASNGKYGRAKRSKGKFLVKKGEFLEAIPEFEAALALNSLFPDVWYLLGFCYMHSNNWEKGANAFTKVVQQKPSDGEAWSNLAALYLKMGRKREAFSALSEAIHNVYDNWKIWDNLLTMSLHFGEISVAVNAMERIMDLKPKKFDDNVLTSLVTLTIEALRTDDSCKQFLFEKVTHLLAKISSQVSNNPVVWRCYARLMSAHDDVSRAIVYAQRAVRSVCASGWEKDTKMLENVRDEVELLVDLYRKCSFEEVGKKAKLFLKPLLSRSQRALGETKEYHCLEQIIEEYLQ